MGEHRQSHSQAPQVCLLPWRQQQGVGQGCSRAEGSPWGGEAERVKRYTGHCFTHPGSYCLWAVLGSVTWGAGTTKCKWQILCEEAATPKLLLLTLGSVTGEAVGAVWSLAAS